MSEVGVDLDRCQMKLERTTIKTYLRGRYLRFEC